VLAGAVEFYDTEKGKRIPPPTPELSSISPRGLQRGTTGTFKLAGKNLGTVTNLSTSSAELKSELQPARSATELELTVSAPKNLARGAYELSVSGPGGPSGKLKLFVDDLPQFEEAASTNIATLPASFWGALDPSGDSDHSQF